MELRTFKEKAKKYHSNNGNLIYDYSLLPNNFYTTDKLIIVCKIHGEFLQRGSNHLIGIGCPKCGVKRTSESKIGKTKWTEKEYIEKLNIKHNYFYDYSDINFTHSECILDIICPIHGKFTQQANNHLNGRGCPKCAVVSNANTNRKTKELFIKESIIIHGDKYIYDDCNYIDSTNKVTIICPIHGKFKQLPQSHLTGSGCSKCGSIQKTKNLTWNTNKFVEKAKSIHGDKYIYDECFYIHSKNKVKIYCPNKDDNGNIHGYFYQVANNHIIGKGCPNCYKNGNKSKQETEVCNFISNLDTEIETSNRTILSNNKELDIYIPSKQIAIEYNGLYWHSELHKDKKYHLQKTEECLAKGIRLIHIFEDEWINKKGIVKSRLSNLLGLTKYHTYARKTILKHIGFSESKRFLDIHHIQGSCNSTIQLGLFSNTKNDGKEKLLAVMTFGPLRKNVGSSAEDGHYELLRFCNFQNLNIVGGASKLLKHFTKNHRPKEIISYCDRRWSDGNLYEKLGFTFSHNSPINYFYIFDQERKNRFGFRKDILVSKYGCSPSMTEREFCFQQGWYRIYDCGTKVYKLTL